LAKYAARIAAGETLEEIGFVDMPTPSIYAVKEAVLPFAKFTHVHPTLGPEMRSTGESMGIDANPWLAFYKAQLGAGQRLPENGTVRFVGDVDPAVVDGFGALGYTVVVGAPKPDERAGADIVVDVTGGEAARAAVEDGVPYVTTNQGARWTLRALDMVRKGPVGVTALQDLTSA